MATLKQRTKFTYEPLDTTQHSIRLISVDPELSPEGFVQCSIRHTTIYTQYNCLSYRWGPPDLSNTLIVNGQALSINGYLNDFLAEVRTFTYKAPDQSIASHLRENLWIDAVCIDQNSTSEKNHQVGQMGKIYTNASKVIMWLGNRYSEDDKNAPIPSNLFGDYYHFILHCRYWTRAWVAQEVMLAKDPVLMIADQFTRCLFPFADFLERNMIPEGAHVWTVGTMVKIDKRPDVLLAWMRMVYDRKDTSKKPGILHWLNELRGVECTLIHDRIFSLMELSTEGKDILVDYNMPVTQLLCRVLEARGQEPCLCEVFLLMRALKIENEVIDSSGNCVYVQWKPYRYSNSPNMICDNGRHAMFLERLKWRRLGIEDKFGQKIARAPLQDFVVYKPSRNKICQGAMQGIPEVPVQVKLGPVYEWQIVSED